MKTTTGPTDFSQRQRNSRKSRLLRWLPAALSLLLYFVPGLLLVPQTGLQDDEVLFLAPLLHIPGSAIFSAPLLHRQVPLMLLTYVGALKSLLYGPLVSIVRPSYLTVRLPALISGTLTAILFIWLLERINGRLVACIGGLLLVTDTTFLLTTCFDWGPVALQHLLALAGVALIVKFDSHGRRSQLAGAFFCFGLAFWDKALFAWFFSGIVVAAVVVFPREVWRHCNLRNVATAGMALCAGALPLLAFNAASNLATFRSNSAFDLSQLPSRLHALRITWDGQIFWGYMVHAPWSPGMPRQSGSVVERLSGIVHSVAGFRYHNELEPAFVLALIFLPLLWFTRARKTMGFCLIAMVVAWFQMAITKGAGNGAHHVVLLWPLPHWFLAVALVEASRWKPLARRKTGAILLGAVVIFLAGENLLLTNEYFYQLSHFGALGSWSDAIFQLADDVGHMPPAKLVADDWGIENSLMALRDGQVSLAVANDHTPMTGDIWVGRTPRFVQRPALSKNILQRARAAGFEKKIIQTVADRNGVPVFEIFRFVRSN